MVANDVLKDKNLSFKAKGLYSYLFSKPDDWDFSSNRMVMETADGRESIMSGLTELENCGYLDREKLPNGRMQYTLKYSSNSLSRENPLRVDKPKSGKPTVAKPHSGKTPPISNTYNPSNKEEKVINTSIQRYEDISFEEFWVKYPRKIAKTEAKKCWNKIKPTELLVNNILNSLENQTKSSQWNRDNGQFIPHASTWLNQQRWQDEIKTETQSNILIINE